MAENKKNKTFKYFDFIIIAVAFFIFGLLGLFGLFNKLDYRFYDFLLGIRKEPAKSDKILHVNIDDESIASIGEWPWSRDIIADALIHMKELGAERVVFDVEYLSPSPMGVPGDAIYAIDEAFLSHENSLVTVISQLSSAVQKGYVRPSDIDKQTEEMLESFVLPAVDSLKDTIKNQAYRNNDEYFAQALQFFGNAWLTVNTRDVIIEVLPEHEDYVKQRLLLHNVEDKKGYILYDNSFTSKDQYNGIKSGFTPAMHTLVSRANGLGFTNVIIDLDGIRRRVELLHNKDGSYAGQLVFAPLMNLFDAEKLERKRYSLIVHNALIPGREERQTFKIPLDRHGRMLINWQHCEFGESFRHESMSFLKQLEDIENDIYQILHNISSLVLREKDGSLPEYVSEAQKLIDEYYLIKVQRAKMLEACTGFDIDGNVLDGISEKEYEDYFSARKIYFEKVSDYAKRPYYEFIEKRLLELSSEIDAETAIQFKELALNELTYIHDCIGTYINYMEEMKNAYSGSFCIVGNTASSTTDLGATPFTRAYPNVGTHANVANTIIQADFIIPLSWSVAFFLAAVLMVASIISARFLPSKIQTAMEGIIVGFVFVIPIIMMTAGSVYVPSMAAVLFAVTDYIAQNILRFVKSEKEKGFIKHAFSTYVSKDIVNQIVKNPDMLKLGGEQKRITALFSDIKGFSSFSELVTPDQLVSILNEYLTLLSDVILENGGTIDKYIGDSIVSFFGAPFDLKNHAFLACASAVKMKKIESEFNKKHMIDGDIPRELFTRVGINTGDMVAGNMGTQMKMNYTIMGNDVNLASRLEGVNKVYGSWILVSDSTWDDANFGENKDILVAKKLDRVRVVGINKPVQLYNILGYRSEMGNVELEQVNVFHEALEYFNNKKFKEAMKSFYQANEMIKGDDAAIMFAQRCESYLSKGVPENWDGVMNLTSK